MSIAELPIGPGPAETIDEVVERLADIVAAARVAKSRGGYFAALYKRVTVRVRDGIARGEFEDGGRVARLDVMFANRFLDAHDQSGRGVECSRCWKVAFDAAPAWSPLVVQHLLLGINAHINLDLGVAAARTAPGPALPALQRDFDQINAILSDLMLTVKAELTRIWAPLRLLDAVAGSGDDALINFSLRKARGAAWSLATQLAPLPLAQQGPGIEAADRRATNVGQLIRTPGLLLSLGLLPIRLGERGSIPEIIDVLDAA